MKANKFNYLNHISPPTVNSENYSLFTLNRLGRPLKIALEMLLIASTMALFLLAGTQTSFGQTRIQNAAELREILGALGQMRPNAASSDIKVAILDAEFSAGYNLAPGNFKEGMLPANTVSRMQFDGGLLPREGYHGIGMAQIIWSFFENGPYAPKLYLLNSNGLNNFNGAVDYAISEKVNIILHSQNLEWGSNFEGTSIFEPAITKARQANIIWINSTGNFKDLIYTQKILPLEPGTKSVQLPDSNNTLRLENLLDDNRLTVTLSWNDFSTDTNHKTLKDLDFSITNASGTEVEFTKLVQKGENPNRRSNPDDKRSALAREQAVEIALDRGFYNIRIEAKSDNFADTDQLQVVLSPNKLGSVRFLRQPFKSHVPPPADSAQVIAVGDCSEISSLGETLDGRLKPDVVIANSFVKFSNSDQPVFGSSNAAALLAGTVARILSIKPYFTQEDLKAHIETLPVGPTSFCDSPRPIWRTPNF